MKQEELAYDIVIVGAGPAGLSAAIRLKQLAQQASKEISVCVVEKASEVGGHILSGAVLQPSALNELLPDWLTSPPPLTTAVTQDAFYFLTNKKSLRLPTPRPMKNHGNYIISLSQFCRWLGQKAESLGVEIYPGFAAAEAIIGEDGQVGGIITNAQGVDKGGNPTNQYQAGVMIHATYTLFAEGCRGSLSEQLMQKFQLRTPANPQTYGIGLKELWEIPENLHQAGKVVHTIGWPLDQGTYGGSFVYHLDKKLLAVGFVIGLDYRNPYLNPYQELQRFKNHPFLRPLLENGKRLSYGARALNEGGFQSIPKLIFPGGAIIGCAAGFLNVPKIKGTHTAMKSGMIAAEAAFGSVTNTVPAQNQTAKKLLVQYPKELRKSWVWQELKRVRNIRPSFRLGLWGGLLYSALDTYILRGRSLWTFSHHADHESLLLASQAPKINYPKPDGRISFDLMSSVFLSNSLHEENQPCHLRLKDPSIPIQYNLPLYDAPEQRYCPAGVYEIIEEQGQPKLQINAQNCIHCKTCDIKDPKQNIVWTTPQGGGGPGYSEM